MSNKIVQLENESGDNLYPIAGGALTGSISKTMLEEGVFEGPELSEPSSVAYVATDNIQDGAVTSDKIDYTTLGANYLHDHYNYTSTTSSIYGSPAINGTHTDAEYILFDKTITAKKSGVFFGYATLVGYCNTGGTSFLTAQYRAVGTSTWTSFTSCAFVPSDVLSNGKGECRLLCTGFFSGTKGTEYEFAVKIGRGNATSYTIESLAGASWGLIEL